MLRFASAFLLATSVLATPIHAASSDATAKATGSPLEKLNAEELKPAEVTTFTLENGLEVVVIPDRRAPVVTHMLWYRVGSADEPKGKSGIAHFLEHLMFKGTKTAPNGEFSRRIAEIGGQENAFTSYDYTGYFQRVSPEALEMVMRFEADRMENLVLSDEVVLPERDVILEERNSRIENNPGAILGEAVSAALYRNHPYGTPIIGWKHEMEGLTREDAFAFYDRFYTPNNAILVVAGNVEPDTVRSLAEKTYGKVERRAEAPPRARVDEPPARTAQTVTLSDPRVRQPSFQRSYLVPSYVQATEDEAIALDVLGEILGGSSTSRLYRALVRAQGDAGVATSAGAYYRGGSMDETTFVLYGTPKPGRSIADLEAAIDAEVERLLTEGVTQAEVERAAARTLRQNIFSRDSQSTLARIYGAGLTSGLTLEQIQTWPEKIAAVKAEDVNAVAKKYLRNNRSVTGYLLPEGTDTETKG